MDPWTLRVYSDVERPTNEATPYFVLVPTPTRQQKNPWLYHDVAFMSWTQAGGLLNEVLGLRLMGFGFREKGCRFDGAFGVMIYESGFNFGFLV